MAASKKRMCAGSRTTYERHLDCWTEMCLRIEAKFAGRFMCAVLSERRQGYFWWFSKDRESGWVTIEEQ